ncbi:family 16 glycosylhydrolase [Lewinella sp. 4G2]|uniref:glycoside hydrolase family 16 protein n=1 Tax=Lewinella sp. 4G2 TaxID=1803372 RepID=UPI0007B4646D|nr:glycoside hydrolase family 16 protein [Lewinella sp. 4G2]OAV45716.1 hypothetical protein A3850_014985 [Lewinella sp. 4G2]
MTARLFLFCCLISFAFSSCETPDQALTDTPGFAPEGYKLVWNDEFNSGPLPDTTKWGYQTGGYGWTAKELQNYLEADPDNVNVSNGLLNITARKEKARTNDYTSTRLVSKGKQEFQYGYIEVRAKMAKGEGLRSAFWLVGAGVSKLGWPHAGEIDLFEHYGSFPTVISGAVQTQANNWATRSQVGASVQQPDFEDEFHVFGCKWTKDALVFSVDGAEYWTYTPRPGKGKSAYPFVAPYYMAATLSVGGIRGPNAKVDDSAFPATMSIDYVRVYQQ